jgi:hypothetical protein
LGSSLPAAEGSCDGVELGEIAVMVRDFVNAFQNMLVQHHEPLRSAPRRIMSGAPSPGRFIVDRAGPRPMAFQVLLFGSVTSPGIGAA